MKEAWLKLLTGLVDGELPPAERQLAEKLLRQSAEARQLYEALKGQSERLSRLPKLSIPVDLTQEVLNRLKLKQPALKVKHSNRRSIGIPAAAYVAAAALVLLTAWSGYLIWCASLEQDRLAEQRKRPPMATRPSVPAGDGHLARLTFSELYTTGRSLALGMTESVMAMGYGVQRNSLRLAIRHTELALKVMAEQRALQGTLVAMAMGGLRPGQGGLPQVASKPIFKRLEFTLPQVTPGGQIGQELARLMAASAAGGLFQLDLAAQDPAKTLERLMAAGATHKVKFIVDAEAQAALRQKKPLVYHIYLENVDKGRFGEALAALDAAERQAAPAGSDSALVSLIFARLEVDSQRQLAQNLGVAPATLVSGAHGELSVPSDKPKVDDLKPAPTKADEEPMGTTGTAVVYVYNPARNGKFATKDIRSFLDQRAGPRPDRVSLLIVVRPAR